MTTDTSTRPTPTAPETRPRGPLARFLAGPPAGAYEPVRPGGRGSAILAILLEGLAYGAGIGLLLGAAVGAGVIYLGAITSSPEGSLLLAVIYLGFLGTVYGGAIGAVAGAVVGLPAATVLATVLASAPEGRPATIHRRTAATLALLLDALVVSFVAWTLTSDTGDDLEQRVLVAFPAIAAGAVLTARLLRRATRYLADGWNERTGWKAVRP